jgi:hypothetical protein
MSRSVVKIDQIINTVTNKLRKSMNKPVQDFKHKGLSVAVWPTKNGGYSYSIQKRYKDKQSGEWRETKSFFKEEIEALIDLLKQAVSYGGNRTEHEEEGIPSGQGKPGPKVQYELSDEELDDIPF